jgi:hypothetical protein
LLFLGLLELALGSGSRILARWLNRLRVSFILAQVTNPGAYQLPRSFSIFGHSSDLTRRIPSTVMAGSALAVDYATPPAPTAVEAMPLSGGRVRVNFTSSAPGVSRVCARSTPDGIAVCAAAAAAAVAPARFSLVFPAGAGLREDILYAFAVNASVPLLAGGIATGPWSPQSKGVRPGMISARFFCLAAYWPCESFLRSCLPAPSLRAWAHHCACALVADSLPPFVQQFALASNSPAATVNAQPLQFTLRFLEPTLGLSLSPAAFAFAVPPPEGAMVTAVTSLSANGSLWRVSVSGIK